MHVLSFTINENFLDNLIWSQVSYDGDNVCIRIGEKVTMSYLFEIRRVTLVVKYLDVGINVAVLLKRESL